jgi:PAS domain S-box-containing protein
MAAFLEARLALRALCDGGALVIDRGGRLVAAFPPDLRAPGPAQLRPQAVAPWVTAPPPQGEASEEPVVAVGVPLRRGGEVVGQLVGRLKVRGGGLLARYATMKIGQTGYLSLTTADRTILMHADPRRVLRFGGGPGINRAVDLGLSGAEGWLHTRNAAGVDMITAVRRLPSTGWVLAANYPLAEARAPYNRALAWSAGGALLGIAVLLAAAWVSMQRITRPLTEMTRQVEALATTGVEVPRVEVRSNDEVSTLASAFNALAEQLSQSRREQVRAEAALRQSEERFRLAFKTSPEPMTLQRADDATIVACNDGFLQLHGLTEAQALGKSPMELGLWTDPSEREQFTEAARATGVVRGLDIHVRGGDGRVHVLALSASIMSLGGVPHVLSLGRDVTEERRAAAELERLAAELRRSEELYRSAVRNVPVVQWVIDADGVFTHSDGKGLKALGLEPGAVVGRSVRELYAGSPGILRDFERALAGERFVTIDELGPVAFESHWAPLLDEQGRITGVTGTAMDITARRQVEAKLLQAQKMEAVGRLASGIAHDFNNLLVVIMSGSEHLLSDPALDAALREVVSEIGAAGERASRLVRQLLAFGRQGQSRPVLCTLSSVVSALEKLLRRTIGEHIELVVSLGADAWSVRVDPTQLDQILMNLAVNARDAMPHGGRLVLETSNVEQRADATDEPPPGRWACLAVSDSGHGMSAEVQARIFDPFFTTKDPGHGTGLGLSTVFGAVQQANGRITVESAPGQGSRFRLYFPAFAAEPTFDAKTPAAPALEGPRLTVLAVEDDDSVRRSTVRMLERSGFVPKEATSGAAGLALLQQGGIDVVLTDVVMPGMSGTELARRLEALGLDLPIVFASGYMDRQLHSLPEGAVVLLKPYTLAELADAVARARAAKGPPALDTLRRQPDLA